MIPSTLITHVATGLAGLIGGYVLGTFERRAQGGRPTRERWGNIGRALVGVTILLLVVFTQVSASRTNTCYRTYFTQVSSALADRSAATGSSSAANKAVTTAQKDFLLAVNDQARAADLPAAIRSYVAEVDGYLASLDQLEQARRAAPLPQPPACES